MALKGRSSFLVFSCFLILAFALTSCSLFGKKKEDKMNGAKTVSIDGMEDIKGVNPSVPDSPPPPRRPTVRPSAPAAPDSQVASIPRPSPGGSLPFLQFGFRKKVVILDFKNNTTYKEEKLEDAVAAKLADRLESSQRIVVIDPRVVSETLEREGTKFESLSELSAMKGAHRSLGIQAFALGTITDVSLLSSKSSETSDEEVSFATAKVEIRLIDASTGNLLRTFIGRSPIFGTRETGEYNRSKAILRAIEFSIDDILEGFLRQVDLLDWTTTIAKIDGENLYVNAGKLSGLRIGDILEVYEPGKEIIHPVTKLSLGWTAGKLKGAIRVVELFGVDAATGKPVEGRGFALDDVVRSTLR